MDRRTILPAVLILAPVLLHAQMARADPSKDVEGVYSTHINTTSISRKAE